MGSKPRFFACSEQPQSALLKSMPPPEVVQIQVKCRSIGASAALCRIRGKVSPCPMVAAPITDMVNRLLQHNLGLCFEKHVNLASDVYLHLSLCVQPYQISLGSIITDIQVRICIRTPSVASHSQEMKLPESSESTYLKYIYISVYLKYIYYVSVYLKVNRLSSVL